MTGRDVRLADAPLPEAQAARLESLCLRREAREPLQYLCGHWSFLDFELIVGPGVLCPRADTEVVAEAAAQTLAGVKAPRVLDLCAGTGCLGLGVKRFCPDAQVTCVEKSPEAFRYLEQNVRTALPGAAPAVQAVQGDLFTYCVTSLQLALAHPSPTGGVAGAAVEFLGVFALTQIPLAVIEGLVTTAAVLALEQCAQPELRLLKSWNEGRAAQ